MANQKRSIKKPLTKSQLLGMIAEDTELTKAQVSEVFESLTTIVQKQIGRNGPGSITAIPGLVKINKRKKAAVPAKKGATNPFTGELYDRPAKPAKNVVKVTALKALKDMV